jgi:serine/threonine protein kinase
VAGAPLGDEAMAARKPAEAVGTLAYMAPEQRQGLSVDWRSGYASP